MTSAYLPDPNDRMDNTMSYWGTTARRHWQRHLPDRYAALDDPDQYFELLDQEASTRYLAIRDSLLDGVSPNSGTTTWPEYLDLVAQADQTAHQVVTHELLDLPDCPEGDVKREWCGAAQGIQHPRPHGG